MDPITIGTKIIAIITDAIKTGKSKQEAEKEAALAVERGDVVSDEFYRRFDKYIEDTADFEKNG